MFAPNADDSGRHAAPDPGNVGASTTPPPGTFVPGQTPTTQILDRTGDAGFPGFDGMEANNALGYTAAAQEAGIPVTYTYLSDVHDDQYGQNHGNAFGPGEAGMEAQLHEYNAAFSAFFHRLADDGITQRNTVFLVTVDEGDHFAGGGPLNPGCDGVHVACQYDTAEQGGAAFGTPGFKRNVGEVDANLPALVKGTTGDATTFGFDNDDAPAIIVPNQTSPSGPRPGPDDGTVRDLEREISGTSEFDPITGQTTPITVNMADQAEESILHMINSDPNRTPTFTLFGNDDFFFQSVCSNVGAAQGATPAPVTDQGPGCPAQGAGFAWNHGDIQPQIATTWQGWVGPGIANLGQTSRIWTDHADARPTLMTLLGLRDDYTWDGRAIEQILDHGGAGRDGRDDHRSGRPGRGQPDPARRAGGGLQAAQRSVRQLRSRHAERGHVGAGRQLRQRRRLSGRRWPAPGVRQRARRAGAADPGSAAAGRDGPAATEPVRGDLADRAGRSPHRRRSSAGELRDAARADALQLTTAVGGPGHPGRARRGRQSRLGGARAVVGVPARPTLSMMPGPAATVRRVAE